MKVQKYLMSSTDHDRMQAALKFKGTCLLRFELKVTPRDLGTG